MDQRTADSLFGSSDDGGLDFLTQSQSDDPAPVQDTPDATATQTQISPATYQPTHTVYEEQASEQVDDPYSSLRTGRGHKGGRTQEDSSYSSTTASAQTNGHSNTYAAGPTMSPNPPASTYGTPPSQGQYDPYAALAHCMSFHNV